MQASEEMYLKADRQKGTVKGNVQCMYVYVFLYVCIEYIYMHA